MRARMSMRWSVTLFTASFLMVSLGLVLAAMLREAGAQWRQSAILHAQTAASLVAGASANPLRRGDAGAIRSLAADVADGVLIRRVVVVGADGAVLADSAGREALPLLLRREGRSAQARRLWISSDQVQVLAPVRAAGRSLGSVFLDCSLHEYEAMRAAMLRRGILIGVLAIIIACAIAYGSARVISTPLRRLAQGIEALARGEVAAPLSEDGCRELCRIVGSFNRMAGSLRRQTQEMASLPALGLAVTRSLNLPEVIQAAVASVEGTLPDTRCQVWLPSAEGRYLVLASDPGAVEAPLPRVAIAGRSVLARAFRQVTVLHVGGGEGPIFPNGVFARRFGASMVAAAPLQGGSQRPVGALAIYRRGEADPFQPEDLLFLSAAANQVALSIENARLFGREKRLASIFHRLLRPVAPADVPGLEIAARWQPASGEGTVGGDYYDFIALPDGRWGIVIGDVCGKGTLAASYTAMARYVVRSYAYETESPAEILQRANAALYAQLHTDPTAEERPMFVTILCAIYDPDSGRLAYSHAGHPLGTLVRP
ncbi:MAG: SpoIIE family protein phosphatase, partial [Armatimonadetes bacterium]|nr:SpoIIE family protein phosphatase [Armatimonadota bacterium]